MKKFYNSFILMPLWRSLGELSRQNLNNSSLVRWSRFCTQSFAVFLFLLLAIGSAFAQAPVITYPAQAQPLTRGLGSSLLSVKVAFSGACENISVEIDLPDGVSYVANSVTRTEGTGAQPLSMMEARKTAQNLQSAMPLPEMMSNLQLPVLPIVVPVMGKTKYTYPARAEMRVRLRQR